MRLERLRPQPGKGDLAHRSGRLRVGQAAPAAPRQPQPRGAERDGARADDDDLPPLGAEACNVPDQRAQPPVSRLDLAALGFGGGPVGEVAEHGVEQPFHARPGRA